MKNYATQILLAVSLLAVAGTAQAQKNFRPGYVVQPAGDTLRGEVDARGGQRMASLCLFRSTASAQPKNYAPADLKAYGLSKGASYESCPMPAAAGTSPCCSCKFLLRAGRRFMPWSTRNPGRAISSVNPAGQ
jgi:hypothetical protein